MSFNRPPQLQLSLHAENGTSFKRSFEQYGFDLDTPLSGSSESGGSGSSGVGSGNERNKRARSESSLSNSDDVEDSSGSSEVGAAGSSGATSIEDDSLSGLSATRPISLADSVLRLPSSVIPEQPRLPSPDFEDIQMAVADDAEPLSDPPPPVSSASGSNHDESYRISLERFNAFESEISALRLPRSPAPALPPISTVADDEDDEGHPRLPSNPFGNLGLVQEDSNIPGLQVFSLGEFPSSGDDPSRPEGAMRFHPVFDGLDETSPLLPQNSSREVPQPRFSTLGPRVRMPESVGPSHEQLPRLSPTPLFSQQDLEWWSSELSSGNPSARSPSRPRPDASSRGATDYMPPRNWFDAPLGSRDRRTRATATFSTTSSAGRRRAVPRRPVELVDDISDEDLPVFFPSVARLAQDRYEQEQSALGRHRAPTEAQRLSSGPSHDRHPDYDADLPLRFSRVDWSPLGGPDPPVRPRSALRPRPHESLDDARRRASGGHYRLPRIETSDFELDIQPHLLGRTSPRPSLERSPDSADSLESSDYATHQLPPADRTAAMATFLHHPMSSDHAVRSSTTASRLPASTSSTDEAESSDIDWSLPYNHNTSARPPATREHFHSRLYSSRVAASNSLVSENAAELRRGLARSQMLQSLPQNDDTLDEFPTLLGPDNPWRARRESETDPWVQRSAVLQDASRVLSPRADPRAVDSLERDRLMGPSLRPYRPYSSSSSTTRTLGRPDDIRHQLLDPSMRSPFARRVVPSSPGDDLASGIHRDRTHPNSSQAAARSVPSLPTSPVFGLPSNYRPSLSRSRTFSSTVDTSRVTSTARPNRAQSPVALQDIFHSPGYSHRENSPMPRQTNHDIRTRARRMSAFSDVGLFRSTSPPAPLERMSRSPEPPRATPASTYASLDLSAYHEGPFRASLQRYVDLDRIRSRLSRLESMADSVSTQPSSRRLPVPPTLPPLRFDSDDEIVSVENTSTGATDSARQPTAFSSTSDQAINFPHMVREARLGRGSFPPPAAPQSSQNYGFDRGENGGFNDPDVRAVRDHWVPRRDRMGSNGTTTHSISASLNSWEDEHRLQRERFHAYDARIQPYRNRVAGNGSPNNHAISPSLTHLADGDTRSGSDRTIEEMATDRVASVRARLRAQMDARAQARINAQRTENVGADNFGEAMDILSADGLSNSTQRQFFDQYQRARDTDTDGFSAVGNDPGESGPRFWPARARNPRRARVYRPSQSGESANISAADRQQRPSPQSATGNSSSSERLAATAAVLAERTARLRASRERVRRDREFMLGDLPRFDLVHFTRPGRNMGDYVRDEDFDSSYENLLSLASTLGEARPRATPNHVIAALPTGFYKDWQTTDSDQRCPICLDDYKPLDPVLKLSDCSHWLHKGCLEQWLHGASTCPVCRKHVNGTRCPRYQHGSDQTPTPSGSGSDHRQPADDDDDVSETGHILAGFGSGTPPWRLWE